MGYFTDLLNRVGTSLKEVGSNLSDVYKPDLKETAKKVEQAVQSSSTPYGLAKDVFIEAPARAVQSVVQSFTGTKEYTPKTAFEKLVFGTEPIKDVQTRTQETQQFIKEKAPALSGGSQPLAFLGVIGMTALDLTPFGGEKNVLKEITKVSKFDDALKIAKKIGVAEDKINDFAKSAVAIKTEKEAKTLLNGVSKVAPEAKKASQEVVPTIQKTKQTLPELQKSGEVTKLGGELPQQSVSSVISKEEKAIQGYTQGLRQTTKPLKTEVSKQLSKSEKIAEGSKSQIQQLPQQVAQVREGLQINHQKVSSYILNDTTKLSKSKGINLDNINISKTGKDLINDTINELRPALEQKVGKTLTNKETIDLADRSSRVLKGAVGKETTALWEASLLNARRKLAASAESGTVDRDFLENLLTIKTQGTDIARKLQSFGIGADAQNISSKQMVLEAILKVNDNVDEILKASKGVDFNDFNQATEFYRKFVKPTIGEWTDLLRYNSMLSSPKTHLVNAFSNLLNTTLIAPIEKATVGGIDFLSSSLTGKARKAFAGESVEFIKGYFSNLKTATTDFGNVLKGKTPISQLDLRQIPLSTKGIGGKVANVLSYPLKLLEGADRFFMALTQAGEKASLEYRVGKGVAIKDIEQKAMDLAQYRLYRQDLFSAEQGKVLDAVDTFTSTLMGLRNSKNPIVSTISKFTVPFIKTPMNIFKQGIEYSPLGVSTIIGAKNKEAQIAKAIIGSTFVAGAATLVASDRLTGAEPITSTGIRDWRQAGKQAYSVKIGNKWVSYQKFPPAISFTFSLLSTVNQSLKERKIDDSYANTLLSFISKYGQFLSDQSYAKSIGDLLSAVQGGESGIERLISNYPQQLIPFRALESWFTRMIDASQRKVDSQANFIDKQIQQLFINMPFLSMTVPARLDKDNNPIPNYNRFWNAFSPVDIKTENEKFATFLNNKEQFNKAIKEQSDIKAGIKKEFQPTYDKIQELKNTGKIEEAKSILKGFTDEQYELYKSMKSTDKSQATTEAEIQMMPKYKEIQKLKNEGKIDEAKTILNSLSDKDYEIYKKLKNRVE